MGNTLDCLFSTPLQTTTPSFLSNIPLPVQPIPPPIPSSSATHTVFISHAGEDKATIAIPLRKKLNVHGITSFVDEADMPPGTPAVGAMESAMKSARIAVIVLSPEFVARKWPMKELMCFLRRREQADENSEGSPVIIPFFYRLGISELYDEPRLDRVNSRGHSLYVKSRFLERMRAGEPETDIEKIQAALRKLHGIMGIRSDLDATNGCTYVMYQRREVLLRELCEEIRKHVPTETKPPNFPDPTFPRDDGEFCAYFDPTPDTSDLLFDFGGSFGEDSSASTQEASILRTVLDESRTANRVTAIHGIGGVGKTSILRGISCLAGVKQQFKDGVHDISLGMDATKGELIEELCKAVERSGGGEEAKSMRRENDVRKAMESFRTRFENKKCLFTVDDVWQSREITSSAIGELMRLHISGDGSKVMMTTRSPHIASRASAHVKLQPRETLDLMSRRMLKNYATIEPDCDRCEEAVREILERCSGLPLFLAVAGKAVKVLSLRRGHEGCEAYHAYARKLKPVERMLTPDADLHEWFADRLMISLNVLEKRKEFLRFSFLRSMAEMHRRLSVLKKQSKVPMRMLKHLWELGNETDAAIVAWEFEQAGLVEVEFETRGCDRVEVLRLHDSLYEFAVSEACRYKEERVGHELILRGYRQGLSVRDEHPEWWNLEDDGYILGNICRHLFAAGRGSELVQLVLSPQWTKRQLKVNGILSLEADFELAIKSVRNGMVDEDLSVDIEIEEALQLISEAAVLSWSFVSRNFSELGFQMHGRLKRYAEQIIWIREYVGRIETDEIGPSALCASQFLAEPGGTNVSIFSVGVPIRCVTGMKDWERVACGCEDGRIAIVNTVRHGVEHGWQAHDGRVMSIAVGRNYSRIVSAARDREVKVWDAETSRCVTTFRGHNDEVLDVTVMADDSRVVSVSLDGTAQIWDMDTGDILSHPFTDHDGPVYCVALLGDGEHVITGGEDLKLRMWSSRTGCQVGVPLEGHECTVLSVAVSPDGRRVVSGSLDKSVRVWDIASHLQIGQSMTGHTEWVWCVAFNRDGSRVASGSGDTTIRIWDVESGNEICAPLVGHGSTVRDVSFLARNDGVVSSSVDSTVRLWDLRRQSSRRIPNRHEGAISNVVFSPNGKCVVSASEDGTLRIWDSTSGDQLGDPLTGHTDRVSDVAIAPNGRLVVSVSDDKTACVWDLQTRMVLGRFTGHTCAISCVAVTPQGDRAVTGSDDRTVRVWDLHEESGDPIILEGHSDVVWRVFVTDDGLRIVSVAFLPLDEKFEDEVLVWDIETRHVVHRLMKRGALRMSRREILDLVGEWTVQTDPALCIPCGGRRIRRGEGQDERCLATVESQVRCWALSPDQKTLCVGFSDGQVGLMKLTR